VCCNSPGILPLSFCQRSRTRRPGSSTLHPSARYARLCSPPTILPHSGVLSLKQSFALSSFSLSSFRKASRGRYPTRLSTGRPLQKRRSVGVPMIPYFRPISVFPSLEKMFNLANFRFPGKSAATASSSGSSLLHHMQESCQKSTSTSSLDLATCSSQLIESRSVTKLISFVSMGISTFHG
jgi:hypothetical protein